VVCILSPHSDELRIDLIGVVGGGVDPNTNATLAAALKRVKAQGVPKENIAKALEKAAKVKSVGETTIYEAIACNSVGMIIECVTDNSNRTVKSLREILTKRSARMAPVGFMFERGGVVRVKMNPGETSESLDAVTDIALLNGALDFEELPAESESGSEIKFYCAPSGLSQLTSALAQEPLVTLLASELEYNPSEKTPVSIEDAEVLEELLQTVEALDDVVRVWTTH